MARHTVPLALVLAACGGAAPAAEEPARAEPGAVAARLAAMPEPPVAWSTRVAALTEADFGEICPYLASGVGLTSDAVTCPDGARVEPYTYQCEPASSASRARSLPCAITFGEIVACYVAIREHPCDHAPLGEGLAECDALNDCGIEVR